MRPAHTSRNWTPPPEVEEYRLLRWIGGGAMGDVFLAHDTLLERPVAIKFIAALEPNDDVRERFRMEARAAARLQHPNVPSIYRVGEIENRPYIVSEFVRGQSLDQVVKPIPWERALELGIGLARGLGAAHRRGVLHRDIKPGNAIVAEDGEAKLLDFGLAKIVAAAREAVDRSGVVADPARPEVSGPRAAARANGSGAVPLRANGSGAVPLRTNGSGPVSNTSPTEVRDPEGFDPTRTASYPPAPAPLAEPPALQGANGTIPEIPLAANNGAGLGGGMQANAAGGPAFRLIAPPPRIDPLGSTMMGLSDPRETETLPYVALGALLPDTGDTPITTRHTPHVAVGTPYYMAPEIWRGEPASRRSDVYSLGALLFELVTGNPPHHEVPLPDLPGHVQHRVAPPLGTLAPKVNAAFASIIERCLSIDPNARFGSGDDLRNALESLRPDNSAVTNIIPEGNPYQGLGAFQAEHRALFFGRQQEISSLMELLRVETFVVIAGDSGVGKSSLCRAGVLPLIERGGLGGDRKWRTVTLVPGRRPLVSVCAQLAPLMGIEEHDLRQLAFEEQTKVGADVRRTQGRDQGLVIFIDQLEELITLADPTEMKAFCNLLSRFIRPTPAVRVIATVRGDFLTRLAALPAIGEDVTRSLYILRPLSEEGTREAIVGPARAKGFTFESEALVETLVSSTLSEGGGLPLLQFTLAELWEARNQANKTIMAAALDRVGGVEGALARHADGVLARMLPGPREAARKILLQLVTATGTRVRKTQVELTTNSLDARAALDALVRGRLLVASDSSAFDQTNPGLVPVGEETIYEVAHEALVAGWKTLRAWLDDSVTIRAARDRVSQAAAEWERLGRAKDALWGARQMKDVAEQDLGELPQRDREFLATSRKALARHRLQVRMLIVGIPIIIVLVAISIRLRERREVMSYIKDQVTEAEKYLSDARFKNHAVEALRLSALKLFDQHKTEEAEKTWAQAVSGANEVEQLYSDATQKLEAALLMENKNTVVRDLVGEVLYERALLAERDGSSGEERDIVKRFRVFDAKGNLWNRWTSPATVTISTSPPGASVLIEKYESDTTGKRKFVYHREPGKTPLANLALAPGSYRLSFTAPGRELVRYPLLLRRGETFETHIYLPQPQEVPSGYVYIPPGRFLYGTGKRDSIQRQWLKTSPLHERQTAGYLISKNEITFREYIEYLNDLPAKERKASLPATKGSAVLGDIRLEQKKSGGWLFSMSFNKSLPPKTADWGKKIVNLQRTEQRIQDWRMFPVSALRLPQVNSFMEWLRRSGRVPGARMCAEDEWERAARGADEREFPHSDALAPGEANYFDTHGTSGMGPDEVGSHMMSASPFGVNDLAGNVWERVVVKPGTLALRGGAFFYSASTSMSTNREVIDASLVDPTVGIRVCAGFTTGRCTNCTAPTL